MRDREWRRNILISKVKKRTNRFIQIYYYWYLYDGKRELQVTFSNCIGTITNKFKKGNTFFKTYPKTRYSRKTKEREGDNPNSRIKDKRKLHKMIEECY